MFVEDTTNEAYIKLNCYHKAFCMVWNGWVCPCINEL